MKSVYSELVISRFFKRVEKKNENECWPWKGGVFRKRGGYGRLQIDKVTRRAHCVAWEIENNKLVKNEVVRHKCDNPICVNPSHLEIGTQADNVMDRVTRGREGDRKGTNNGKAKLTENDVLLIRYRYSKGESAYRISNDFPVCKTTIERIINKKLWRHIK